MHHFVQDGLLKGGDKMKYKEFEYYMENITAEELVARIKRNKKIIDKILREMK